jgi:hypothetical protein
MCPGKWWFSFSDARARSRAFLNLVLLCLWWYRRVSLTLSIKLELFKAVLLCNMIVVLLYCAVESFFFLNKSSSLLLLFYVSFIFGSLCSSHRVLVERNWSGLLLMVTVRSPGTWVMLSGRNPGSAADQLLPHLTFLICECRWSPHVMVENKFMHALLIEIAM